MSQISIDVDSMGELMLASRDSEDHAYYFSTRSSNIEIVSHSLIKAVLNNDRSILDHLSDEEEFQAEIVKEYYSENESPYILLPQIDHLTEFSWLSEFSYTFPDRKLYDELNRTLNLPGLIQRLEEIIKKSPEDFGMWINFRNSKKVEEATSVLEQLDMTESNGFRHIS